MTRPISNSGSPGGSSSGNSLYQGELNEFDVLGVDRDQNVTEVDISKALDTPARVRLKKGNLILLIQSGAMFPDEPMMTELGKYLNVVPFSGIPSREGRARDDVRARSNEPNYAKSLRLSKAASSAVGIVTKPRKDFSVFMAPPVAQAAGKSNSIFHVLTVQRISLTRQQRLHCLVVSDPLIVNELWLSLQGESAFAAQLVFPRD